jgi:hypothetical protein
MEQYGDTDITLESKMEQLGTKDADLAYEELIADACETMLLDSNAAVKLMQLRESDLDLFEKIKLHVLELLNKIRTAYKKLGLEATTDEAQALLKMEGVLEKLYAMFEEAAVDAAKNYQANAKPIPSDEIITDGAVVIEGNKKFSIKSMRHDIAEGQMFEDLKKYCGMSQTEVDKLKTQLNELVDYMNPFRDIVDLNETYGREGRKFSPYKPNSDPLYTISLDFSTQCSKRLLTQYVIEKLQLRENRPMSAEEQMAIRDMLKEYGKIEKGLQVACVMCYVEAARLKAPKQIQKWLDDPATQMRNYFADKNPEFSAYIKKAQEDFKESRGYARNATKKDMSSKDVSALNKIRPKLRAEYTPSTEEAAVIEMVSKLPNSTYLTAGNLANLSETHPDVYKAYTSFIRTATRSKALETDEPYYYGDSRRDNGNGIVVSDSFIEDVNRENGMRFSSWSDWRIQHLLDWITAVIDNSVRGAAMHGHTKYGDEVRVLGKTGMMFNLSGVPGTQNGLNEDGTLNFSDTESIDYADAIKLRKEFPETAGLQCIGVSKEHILALLRSEVIDYVIPYHTSGMNATLRRMGDIYGWKDFTQTQHATEDKSIKKENAEDPENFHVEPVFSEFFVGYKTDLGGVEAMRQSAENYIRMCKERGLVPKFLEFTKEPNYWKLLIDRKMVNTTTNTLVEQKAVRPEFDFGVIRDIVDQYVANYDSGLEERAFNHIVENWDNIPKRIRDLKKQGSTKAKKAIDTLANEPIAAQPVEEVIKKQMKKTSDKEYLDAVNRGDMETAQRMVDEAAKEAGYTVEAYHGTKSDFTKFSKEKFGANFGNWSLFGAGFYFAPTKRMAEYWGDLSKENADAKVMRVFLRASKMLQADEPLTNDKAINLIKEKSPSFDKEDIAWTLDRVSRFVTFMVNKGHDANMVREFFMSMGYDGVDYSNLSAGKYRQYVVFDPEQIKSADPVTYDDNGNVIPLSERFNSDNNDIRYQMKKTSNRAILAEALEGVAQNDIEKNKLAQYKAKIDLLTAEEQKLQGLRAEIKELSFAKGPRDTKQIRELQDEATKTANRINNYDRQLLNLEATTALKNVLEREKARVRKAEAEKGKEALNAYRKKAEAELRDTVLRYQESRHKAVEGRHKTEERHAIAKIAKDLDKLLNHGTKERNVKKGASDLVRSALDLANMYFASDDDIITSGIATQMTDAETKLIEKYTALYDEYHSYDDSVTANKVKRADLRSKMNAIRSELSDVLEREKKRINDTTASGIYDTLIKEYKKLSGAEESYLREAFDQDVVEYIEEMRKKVGNNLIGDMTLEQLKDLHRAFTMIKTVVQKSNKLFGEKNRATIAEQGESAMAEIEKQGHKATFTHTGKLASTMSFNNLKPIYLIERTKSKVLQERMQEILDGESIWAIDMEEGRAFLDEAKKKHGYDKWDFDKAYEFETETGLKYSLTLGEIFSIYAYSKRGEQALNHLRVDGFVFDKTKKIKNGKGFEVELNDSTSYAIDDKTRLSILGKLTAEQRAFIDETQKYLSEVMGEKGNEVSREMYGIDLFGEENYFPLRAEGAYLERAREQANGQVKYKNRGFTKATEEGARNSVVLSDYSKVWAEHVAEMSGYHAFTLALENFYKVYNYQNKSSTETNKKGVIPALNNAYGDGITKAIDQLLADLNGGARSDPRESLFKSGLSLFKKAKTMFSLSVVIQQPSALLRAQAMIDAKYFVGSKVGDGNHKKLWKEIKKYAPVAVIKEMGRFDVGMGRSSAEWLLNDKNWREIVDDFLSKGASYADEVAWIKIWNAVKRETLHTEPTLKPNSEEFLKKAGQRFEDIIRHTQVYDSTLSRSGNMRSKSGLMQIVTAFLAEPTTAINMREMALRSGDKNRVIKTTVAVYASTLLNAVLVALPYAMRDDDEDETFIEKYATALTTSFVDNINPLTSLPFIKDIYSMLQGYDVKRSDMALADDTAKPRIYTLKKSHFKKISFNSVKIQIKS